MKLSKSLTRMLAIRRARRDPAAFAEFVLRDGRTGLPVQNAPVHVAAHDLMNRCARLAMPGSVELGKTENWYLARCLWELGRDPTLNVMVASANMTSAEKLVDAVGFYVEHSPEVRSVFPALKLASKSAGALRVVGAPPNQKDPSLIATSPDASPAQGFRARLVFLEDVVTRASARTAESRDALFRWYLGFVVGRCTPDARIYAFGNVHHTDDLLHRLGRLDGWTFRTFPLVDPTTGASVWPQRWPQVRIEERRREVGPVEWARTYLCDASLADETPAFSAAGVAGAMRPVPSYVFGGPHQTAQLVGVTVDPAFGIGTGSDWTGLAATMLDASGRRELLEVKKVKARLDGITAEVFAMAGRWGARVVGVESNGGGSFLADDLQRAAPKLRVVSMHTTSASRAERIAALSAELDRGLWTFPDRPGVEGDSVRALARALVGLRADEHLDDAASALMLGAELLRAEQHRPRGQVGTYTRDHRGLRIIPR